MVQQREKLDEAEEKGEKCYRFVARANVKRAKE